MTSRNKLILQHLGITHWVIRRPIILYGKLDIRVFSPKPYLLVVSSEPMTSNNLLLCDVLRALRMSYEQVIIFTPDKYAMLKHTGEYYIWYLGTLITQKSTIATLYSPPLSKFYKNVSAKRSLWHQIYMINK
ncbi:DNA polymerase III subunit psi [Candidatus Profftia sp. (ex Adelges kitamiensis)]|uniref:DNA polymerase III subunit psi n=1 Tax=Candidatus Profftia sp. (ex Adelges kitamiensis) TaxID=2864218 RepID=UPI001CE23B76|nr:DNA polymerase III subunit psi [Candidatus Profftia sp. (ex Adelges kitamiensis)]